MRIAVDNILCMVPSSGFTGTGLWDSLVMLSHHQFRPADEPAMVNHGQNNFRPVNAVRDMGRTGIQLLWLGARRID